MEKCQKCNKKAKYNRANADLIYEIQENGDLIEIGNYLGSDSEYLCEEHIGKFYKHN